MLLAGGLLHDTLEDADATYEDLVQRFGPEVAALVAEVTDDKALRKEERKRLQIEKTPIEVTAGETAKNCRQDLQPAQHNSQPAERMDSRNGCATMSCGPSRWWARAAASISRWTQTFDSRARRREAASRLTATPSVTERIVILGGGFAGLWSALGAARAPRRRRASAPTGSRSYLINVTAWHSIRVRNYEANLGGHASRPLDSVLGPVGVHRIEGEVSGIDVARRNVAYQGDNQPQRTLTYDRLVFALGSRLARPPITGLDRHAFDVDTHAAAQRLNAHITGLAHREPSPGHFTVLVVGGGLTGIEAAAEMPGKLRAGRHRVAAASSWPITRRASAPTWARAPGR